MLFRSLISRQPHSFLLEMFLHILLLHRHIVLFYLTGKFSMFDRESDFSGFPEQFLQVGCYLWCVRVVLSMYACVRSLKCWSVFLRTSSCQYWRLATGNYYTMCSICCILWQTHWLFQFIIGLLCQLWYKHNLINVYSAGMWIKGY